MRQAFSKKPLAVLLVVSTIFAPVFPASASGDEPSLALPTSPEHLANPPPTPVAADPFAPVPQTHANSLVRERLTRTANLGCNEPADVVNFDTTDEYVNSWIYYHATSTPFYINWVYAWDGETNANQIWISKWQYHNYGPNPSSGPWCWENWQQLAGTVFQARPGKWHLEIYFGGDGVNARTGTLQCNPCASFTIWPKVKVGGTFGTTPGDGKTVFTPSDGSVRVYVDYDTTSMNYNHQIAFRWYRPDGTQHSVGTSFALNKGSSQVRIQDSLAIDSSVRQYPGNWRVRAWIDSNNYMHFTDFQFTLNVPQNPPDACWSGTVNGRTVNVDATCSSDPDGETITYDWDWGDGTAHGTQRVMSHTYTVCPGGTFRINLTVRDSRGATDWDAKFAQVQDSVDNDNDGLPACGEAIEGTSDNDNDTDDDGLWDVIESRWWVHRNATFCNHNNGTCEYPSPTIRDLYLEVDWFQGRNLLPQTKANINGSFVNSPLAVDIRVHIDDGRFGGGGQNLGTDGNVTFDHARVTLHRTFMNQTRWNIFRYVVMACRQPGDLAGNVGGTAEGPGDDVIIYDCNTDGSANKAFLQTVILMQEIGHNILGLRYEPALGDSSVPRCQLYERLRNVDLGHIDHTRESDDCDRANGRDMWSHSSNENDNLYGGPLSDVTTIGYATATWDAIKLDMGVGPNRRSCISQLSALAPVSELFFDSCDLQVQIPNLLAPE